MSQGLTPGVPGAPEPRMCWRSGYFLVSYISKFSILSKNQKMSLIWTKIATVHLWKFVKIEDFD